MPELYFGGIEGGATHSKAVICDKFGAIISKVTGPSTNHWVSGIPEVARRVAAMIESAKTQANISQGVKLQSLGLSLSGCEQDSTNKELEQELLTKFPHISETYYVCSDTMGSIFTASPLGGMVLIAGTGSNALLRNPDGTTFTCGGWGNFLADEGAAWWIAHKAIKTVFDHEDKLVICPYDTSAVWAQIQKHFNIENRYDLLNHCYANFDKAFFASLCEKLSYLAIKGDELCLYLFEDAGRFLAKATAALIPNVSDQLLVKGNLNIVCVGSVWKSWHLLKGGYTKEILKSSNRFGLNLITLTQAMAIGAVYLGSDAINFDLPRDYSHNYDIFQYFPPNNNKLNGVVHTNGVATKTHNGLSYNLNGNTNDNTNGNANGNANGNTNTNGTTNGTVKGKHTNGLKSPSAILIQDG